MNLLRHGFRKLSFDRHTYIHTDVTKIIYHTTSQMVSYSDKSDLNMCLQANYDAELLALHELIQQKVSTLLTDPDNVVKRTLLMHGIKHLCVFFGRQKGSLCSCLCSECTADNSNNNNLLYYGKDIPLILTSNYTTICHAGQQ